MPICNTIEIAEGSLENTDGSLMNYTILTGLDLVLSQKCDVSWGTYTLKILEEIRCNCSDDKIEEVIKSLQIEDSHWNWFNKSLYYTKSTYNIFYLIAQESIQGMCITYQPKKSLLEQGDIFYVEYIAVAPWNRVTLINERQYKNVGSIMLAVIIDYLSCVKSLTPAFSLHSLPQASGYYEKLGMIHCPQGDKDRLKFFEIPLNESKKLLKGYTYARKL